MSDDLVAVCDLCLNPIDDGQGVLETDAAAADRALHAWHRRAGTDPNAVFHTTPGTRPVPWTTRHHTCGRAPRFPYTIAVERVRTWPGLLQWDLHLADKPWAQATDWNGLVARALNPHLAALSGLLPRRPRDLGRGPVGDRPDPRTQ